MTSGRLALVNEHDDATGLRERKKRATRTALSEAALRLAVERGLDDVRVADIAAAAGVSPRTMNNYFSSKEEAVVALGSDHLDELRSALADRPAGEGAWTALTQAILSLYPADPDREWLAAARLIRDEPSLQAARARTDARIQDELAEAIRARPGMAAADEASQVAAMVAISAVHLAVDRWLFTDANDTLPQVLARVLRTAGNPARLLDAEKSRNDN